MSSIYDFVKEQRDSYRSDTLEITDGYEFSQYETLRTIELYHNSRFTTGNTDSLWSWKAADAPRAERKNWARRKREAKW